MQYRTFGQGIMNNCSAKAREFFSQNEVATMVGDSRVK